MNRQSNDEPGVTEKLNRVRSGVVRLSDTFAGGACAAVSARRAAVKVIAYYKIKQNAFSLLLDDRLTCTR